MRASSWIASGGWKLGSGVTDDPPAAAATVATGADPGALAAASAGVALTGHDVVTIESDMLDDTMLMRPGSAAAF